MTIGFFNSGKAFSDIIIEFSDGVTTGTNFDVSAGDAITFFVFVTETNSNTQLSVDGLAGFGLHADYSASSGTSATVTANSTNPVFDFEVDTSFSNSELDMAAFILTNSAPKATSIQLGQFTVQTSASGVTNFVFGDYSNLTDFVTGKTPTPEDLDPTIFSGDRTFDLTLNAVPEASSSIFVLLSGLIFTMRRRRPHRLA